ncbi:ABC transporter ATP-binding protein [Spiroplasma platyhelix]|uniref:ABC transporter ATP-binding protein n=1 Tax=Spiroplasma platyhelix PALS-1 TaxID=1276218 RepID=A0A846TWX0_9MOLU|nr:ABC transporter ATP-binding protein [Spiroplasma platyhelix]MBE4704320.1 Xylose import ATP-binding protein XylG [Spiroplasma platyhelix PALS-1]NKE38692.1 ABC transporter ATP-binding protein [Spiroplasma platyhelix PALS-1]UJB28902.1 ribose/galactose ABC transporter ATP-binding protein [Spiroplasma platyhelix PALS-1]
MAEKTIKYAVEMKGITKIFLDTIIANNNISLKVKKGEIHALVGENGAGKSTLMSILFGLYQPTKGLIKINDKQVVISNSIKATELGIGMVHQHFKLVDNFTMTENIILGSESVVGWQWLDFKKAKKRIVELSKKYKLNIDPNLKVENSSVGMQQRVEILKVLYRGADIIVLDEPTAVLTPQEITSLLEIVKELKNSGKTIIFISHKLGEVKAIADTVTVIRNGKVVESFLASEKTKSEIAALMVGRELVAVKNQSNIELGPTLLKIENLHVKKMNSGASATKFKSLFKKKKSRNHEQILGLEKFNLEIKAGEIVAIAGVEGNGQSELIYSLTGLMKVTKGKVFLNSQNVTNFSARKLYHHGLSHIPEDRHKYGLVLDYTVIDNMVLQNVDQYPFSKFSLLRKKAIQNYAQKIISSYDVRGSDSGFALARGLSGGNQQKAVVGRELNRKHQLLIVAQPTRGLDIGAIEYIHQKLLEEKEKGNAVLLISYELFEVMTLADRIVVLHSGKVTGDVSAKNIKKETLGLMMAGQKWSNISPKSTGTKKAERK